MSNSAAFFVSGFLCQNELALFIELMRWKRRFWLLLPCIEGSRLTLVLTRCWLGCVGEGPLPAAAVQCWESCCLFLQLLYLLAFTCFTFLNSTFQNCLFSCLQMATSGVQRSGTVLPCVNIWSRSGCSKILILMLHQTLGLPQHKPECVSLGQVLPLKYFRMTDVSSVWFIEFCLFFFWTSA